MIGTTARWLVPPPARRARTPVYPTVRVVILDATTSSLVPQLVGGQLDLAVVNTPVDDPELRDRARSSTRTASSWRPPAIRSTTRESITLAELAEHELLLEAQGTAFRDRARRRRRRRPGVTLRAKAEVDGMRLLASLAFIGLRRRGPPGVSAAPGWLGGDWRAIPIDEHRPSVGGPRPTPQGPAVGGRACRRRAAAQGRRRGSPRSRASPPPLSATARHLQRRPHGPSEAPGP